MSGWSLRILTGASRLSCSSSRTHYLFPTSLVVRFLSLRLAMPAMSFPPYAGTSRKLVLAIDVGTTFSGVSYAILDPGEVPTIQNVNRCVNLCAQVVLANVLADTRIS